ncbi:hypothetical protein BDN70DRAFT_862417 [Pholiota conissans]|uniref:MYND-type domain-containing protein n=1 Tax=Pholiota conissans TaxID=109636 RepID=A0A9P6CXY7_9AGAR|nr:hypothetical protein BDN70DRAFT_862417 [Pholiota conissans]
MAHSVIWPKKTFFYPIGNTPPICLTQGLAPEKRADILLLGCGDPRNILYTVYADLGDGNRPLDVTCCDWEPAVLARNILLLTMIVDGVNSETAWSIFYHLFLDEPSFNILIAQCRTLLQSSSDMTTWKNSKYGSFIRFCTDHTLSEIRRHWGLYAESKDLTEAEHKAWKASFLAEMKAVRDARGATVTTLRSAGPLFISIFNISGQKSYTLFWTSGITKSKSSKVVNIPYVNPTFSYSLAGKMFNVHYGTDPIAAFFLAPALAKKANGVTIEDLTESAKSQFSSWCSSFKTRLEDPANANVVVRFFVGEVLAFCQTLHICKEKKTTEGRIYAHPWGGAPIVLDEGDYGNSATTTSKAPLLFNIIDTSNLADHVGLVNLLVVTVPLLERKPWSSLYTNTLLRPDSKGPPESGLSTNAFADIPSLSILVGIAPSPHLWHFTTHSNKHEILSATGPSQNPGQLHESISWHFISSFAPNTAPGPQDTELGRFVLLCDAKMLAKFFFSVYLKMFSEENQIANFANAKAGNTASFTKQNVIHYIRASFVAFLAFVKGSVRVDWVQAMDHLVDLLGAERTFLMGLNNYQDVMCHLYMRNVHTLDVLTSAHVETVRTTRDRFRGWKSVPPVVCIVLKIPRQKLKSLEDIDPDKIMTPVLQGEVLSSSFHNIFSSVQLTFGDTSVSDVDGEPQVTIKEDAKGWNGRSSLIATFYLPSWILTIAPTSTQVGLHIRSTPTSMQLMPILGMRMAIFSTPLTDTAHVHVVRHRPGNVRELEYLRTTPAYSPPTASETTRDVMVKFDPSGERVTHLIVRKDITDPVAAGVLASGIEVSVTPVTDSALLIAFGGNSYRFVYPFAIQIKRLQTRIARKSSYIEIEAPIRPDFSDFRNLSLNPFAVAYDTKQINLLNVHYLNLEVLPALSLPGNEKDLHWVSVHSGMMLSQAEKEVQGLFDQGKYDPLVNLKESIALILMNYAGLQIQSPKGWSNIFGLNDPLHGGVHTLIFVNAMKFDLASHTIVIDACAVPLFTGIMNKITPALTRLTERHFIQVVTQADENRAWKLLLPVLAERCRTWKHTNSCEYCTRGIPASVGGLEYSPLCSCGKGKNLGKFGTNSEWKLFHGEATRVAIGPLFTFSFMEDILKSIAETSEDMGTSNSMICANCGGPGKPTLSACSVCRKTQYCSRECQKAHWKVHKKICATLK